MPLFPIVTVFKFLNSQKLFMNRKLLFTILFTFFIICIFIFAIINPKPKFARSYRAILSEAVRLKNPGVCSEIPAIDYESSWWRTECYYMLASLRKDASLCNEADTPTRSLKLLCEHTVKALVSNNSSLCKSSSLLTTEDCYANFAIFTRDPIACKHILTEFSKDVCYSTVAYLKQDPTICQYVKNEDEKNYCIAISTRNSSLCRNVGLYNSCYHFIAVAEKNVSICDLINVSWSKDLTESLKKACIEDISVETPLEFVVLSK
jgi:hypothetical protein